MYKKNIELLIGDGISGGLGKLVYMIKITK